MKVLKDEIRDAIVNSAKEEFFKKGYERSSMRSIAKGTNTTVGNIYKYFVNKEALFSHILDPITLELENLINHHDDELEPGDHSSIDQLIEQQGAILIDLVKKSRIELLILMYGSEGSKFKGIKDQLVSLLSQGTKKHLISYYSRSNGSVTGPVPVDPLAYALAQSFFEGIFTLIRNSSNPEEIEKSGIELIKLFFNGFKTIL